MLCFHLWDSASFFHRSASASNRRKQLIGAIHTLFAVFWGRDNLDRKFYDNILYRTGGSHSPFYFVVHGQGGAGYR